MGGWHSFGFGMMWAWFFLAVLVVGTLMVVVALVRGWPGGRASLRPASGSRARQILDERLARGEIDTAEHQDRLRQMGESA